MKFKKYISAVGIASIVLSTGHLSFAVNEASQENNGKQEILQEMKNDQFKNEDSKEIEDGQFKNEDSKETENNQFKNEDSKEIEENTLENKEFDNALNTYISTKYKDTLEVDRVSIKNDIIKYSNEVGVGQSEIPYFYECVDIARQIDEYIIEKNKQDIVENKDKVNYILDNFDDIVNVTELSEFEVRERVLSLIPEENNEEIIEQVNDELDTEIPLTKEMPLTKGIQSRAASYNYNETLAINYAKKFAHKNNSAEYPVFGADCANFVSQSLKEGGVRMVQGSVSANSSWFCNSKNANNTSQISSTWRGAQSFRWHWGERAKGGMRTVKKSDFNSQSKFVNNVYNKTYKGDAISLVNSQGMAYHTIIVTDRNTSSKKMSYAAHSDKGNGDLYNRINSSAADCIRIYGI